MLQTTGNLAGPGVGPGDEAGEGPVVLVQHDDGLVGTGKSDGEQLAVFQVRLGHRVVDRGFHGIDNRGGILLGHALAVAVEGVLLAEVTEDGCVFVVEDGLGGGGADVDTD